MSGIETQLLSVCLKLHHQNKKLSKSQFLLCFLWVFQAVANANYSLQPYPQSMIKQTLLPGSNPQTPAPQTGDLQSTYLQDTVWDAVSATGWMQNAKILNIYSPVWPTILRLRKDQRSILAAANLGLLLHVIVKRAEPNLARQLCN